MDGGVVQKSMNIKMSSSAGNNYRAGQTITKWTGSTRVMLISLGSCQRPNPSQAPHNPNLNPSNCPHYQQSLQVSVGGVAGKVRLRDHDLGGGVVEWVQAELINIEMSLTTA